MKKRILMILAVAVLLVGCGNTDKPDTDANKPQTETDSTTEALGADTEEETTVTESEKPHEHAYTDKVTKEATCTEAGEKTFTCECGDTYTEAIEATGHDYKDETKAPTCSEKGYITHTCKTCGNSYTDTEVSATGHSYGKYTYNNDATYEKDGTETATCSACGKKNTRTKAGTKLEPETHWYDGYERYVWYDMGEYFFMIVNTQDEVIPYTNSFPYHQTLQERYPDRAIIQNGSNIITPSYSVALISALYMDPEKGFPIWSIDYLWN